MWQICFKLNLQVCAVLDNIRGNCSSPIRLDPKCKICLVDSSVRESLSFQLYTTALQGRVSTDDGDDSDNTLGIVITAVATCVATALAVGLLCFVIFFIYHRMYKKRMQKTVSFNNDYELKT